MSVCECVLSCLRRLSPVLCVRSDIRGLSNVSHLEQLNKRYWYVCQDFTEYKFPHQPKRFPEIMMCLPEIRCIAGETSVRHLSPLYLNSEGRKQEKFPSRQNRCGSGSKQRGKLTQQSGQCRSSLTGANSRHQKCPLWTSLAISDILT